MTTLSAPSKLVLVVVPVPNGDNLSGKASVVLNVLFLR